MRCYRKKPEGCFTCPYPDCIAGDYRKSDDQEDPGKPTRGREGFRVVQLSKTGRLIKEWENAKEAAQANGWEADSIRRAARGASRSYHGFIWKYK